MSDGRTYQPVGRVRAARTQLPGPPRTMTPLAWTAGRCSWHALSGAGDPGAPRFLFDCYRSIKSRFYSHFTYC